MSCSLTLDLSDQRHQLEDQERAADDREEPRSEPAIPKAVFGNLVYRAWLPKSGCRPLLPLSAALPERKVAGGNFSPWRRAFSHWNEFTLPAQKWPAATFRPGELFRSLGCLAAPKTRPHRPSLIGGLSRGMAA